MKAILQCLILGGILALAACGKDGGSSAAAPTAVVTPNGCTADQIPTAQGCGVYSLQQCGPNMGLVGAQCYPQIAQNCAVNGAAGAPYNPNYPNQYNSQYNPQYPNQFGQAGCNNGLNNGFNNGFPQQTFQGNSGLMVYNAQTQSFQSGSTYYVQPQVVQPMYYQTQPQYGYRPYYPQQNGVSVSATFSF